MDATTAHQRQVFVTLSALATTFGVSRAVIATWLVEIGLCTGSGTPTKKALTNGFGKVLSTGGGGVLVLWHRQRVTAVLKVAGHSTANEQQARDALSRVIATARSVMAWGEIQEVVIAMKAKDHGVEARII
jgi:hypothetical protein